VEIFNLRKLNELGVRKQYQIEISEGFIGLENLSDGEDINWENIKEHIKISAEESLGVHELEQRLPRSDEECLGCLDKGKQAKIKWVQDPSQNSLNYLNNQRRPDKRHCSNEKKEYHSIKKNIEALLVDNKEIGLEVNADRTKYMVMSGDQCAGRSNSIKIDTSSSERVEEFKYLGRN
jgi:hypothetical protein